MALSRMRDAADTRLDFETLDSAIASGMYLKDVVNRQGEDFYYMHTLIEVTAGDSEALEHRVMAVERLCVSVDVIARRCEYKQTQAFCPCCQFSISPRILNANPAAMRSPAVWRQRPPSRPVSCLTATAFFPVYNIYNRPPVFLRSYSDYSSTSGLAGKGSHASTPAPRPEIAARPAPAALPAAAVFLCVLHQELSICHILCHTLAHEVLFLIPFIHLSGLL